MRLSVIVGGSLTGVTVIANVVVPIWLGIFAGFAALAVIFTLFYRFGVRIPMRPFFTVTSALLYYMALVFTGTGFRELQEGQKVNFDVTQGQKGPQAENITPA